MIKRLFPLIGTSSLLFAVAMLGWKMAEVYKTKPVFVSKTAVDAPQTPAMAATRVQVPQRPAIYYAAITDRPLFEPSRRPYTQEETAPEPKPDPVVEAPTPTAPAELPPPELILQGVMTLNDNVAALIGINGETPEWVSKGDPVSDWTLSEVGSDWIEISRKARHIRVEMYK